MNAICTYRGVAAIRARSKHGEGNGRIKNAGIGAAAVVQDDWMTGSWEINHAEINPGFTKIPANGTYKRGRQLAWGGAKRNPRKASSLPPNPRAEGAEASPNPAFQATPPHTRSRCH